jgi:O-antigen/teichoic acid export membrane protein
MFTSTSWDDIQRVAQRYRRFPIYSTWGGGFNRLSTELPSLLFASFFTPAAAGQYSIAYRVLVLPIGLVSRAISDVFFADAAEAYSNGRLAPLISKVHNYLSLLAAPPALILMVYGPELFSFVFGNEWLEAGIMARWLAPAFYFQFISSPLSTILNVIERPDLTLILNTILLGLRIIALTIGSVYGNLVLAVVLFGVSSAFGYAIFSLTSASLGGSKFKNLLITHVRSLLRGGLVISPAVLLFFVNAFDKFFLISVFGVVLTTFIYYFRIIKKNFLFNQK